MTLNAIVTGGSGFLGHAVILALQKAHPEWNIYNLDLLPGKHDLPTVEYIQADITDASSVSTAFSKIKPTITIHCAGIVPNGQTRYSTSPSARSHVYAINVTGTHNVLSAALTNGCAHFIYTSSCTVITDDVHHDYPAMREDLPTGHASLVYGASKTHAEAAVLAANGTTGMTTCALRPSTIIGPGDSYGVIATIHACIANGETPFVIGSGHNMYDIVYVDNVAHAHVLAAENLLARGRAAGQAFFVSNLEPVYFRDFMLAIWAHFGHRPRYQVRVPLGLARVVGLLAEGVSWVTGRGMALSRGSVLDAAGTRWADCAKAQRVLGYEPVVGFAEGVRRACVDFERVLEERQRGGKVSG